MIDSTFNTESRLLETRFHGPITKEEVLEYVNSLRDAKDYPDNLKIITDATEANLEFSREELGEILTIVNDHPGLYDSIKDAMIMTSPKMTAFSMIVEMFTKNSPYHVKIFSTREAALEWLSSQ